LVSLEVFQIFMRQKIALFGVMVADSLILREV